MVFLLDNNSEEGLYCPKISLLKYTIVYRIIDAMKQRIIISIVVSVLLIGLSILGATILASNGSMNPNVWLDAQRQQRLLWVIDGLGGIALLVAIGSSLSKAKLMRAQQDFNNTRAEYQKQLERMLQGSAMMDSVHADQADQLAELEQASILLRSRLDGLDTEMRSHVTGLETEVLSRVAWLEAKAHANQEAVTKMTTQLADTAFAPMREQIDLITRQMDAVILAMQYQRAEIKQLRQNLRMIQASQQAAGIGELSSAEQDTLNDDTLSDTNTIGTHTNLFFEPTIPHSNPTIAPSVSELALSELEKRNTEGKIGKIGEERENAMRDNETRDRGEVTVEPSKPAPAFVPTMKAETTFVSPPTAFTVAPFFWRDEIENEDETSQG